MNVINYADDLPWISTELSLRLSTARAEEWTKKHLLIAVRLCSLVVYPCSMVWSNLLSREEVGWGPPACCIFARLVHHLYLPHSAVHIDRDWESINKGTFGRTPIQGLSVSLHTCLGNRLHLIYFIYLKYVSKATTIFTFKYRINDRFGQWKYPGGYRIILTRLYC
jgi:hypothetical protein